jgi:hypothetical protein
VVGRILPQASTFFKPQGVNGTGWERGAYAYDTCPSDPFETEPGICGCNICEADDVSIRVPAFEFIREQRMFSQEVTKTGESPLCYY